MIVIMSFFVFFILIGLMSIGVIFAKKPIKGSCGGLSNLGLKEGCFICGGKGNKNLSLDAFDTVDSDLYYDVTAHKK